MDDFIKEGPEMGPDLGEAGDDLPQTGGEETAEAVSPEGDESDFGARYVKELREENRKRRLENQRLRAEMDALNISLKSLKDALSRYFDFDDSAGLDEIKRAAEEGLKAAEEALVYSAFASEATRAGLSAEILPDAFKLAELDGVVVDLESREVTGAADAVKSLLEKKAYLLSVRSTAVQNIGSETNPLKGRIQYSSEIEELAGELGVTAEFAEELSRQRSERTGERVGLSQIWRRPKKTRRTGLV
ncbi:MAG: hypothetical protein JW984_05580 [Deltaproteobacteria bacterium]|uniref:Uncharacterized protein n=1 Tax=Candidatus Zymogenus saltonus TaxID=2844893 RepID=A0A9D8KEH1_9DELT|nr:hypothetical protein [Candidatus Zymogenus saltonus]